MEKYKIEMKRKRNCGRRESQLLKEKEQKRQFLFLYSLTCMERGRTQKKNQLYLRHFHPFGRQKCVGCRYGRPWTKWATFKYVIVNNKQHLITQVEGVRCKLTSHCRRLLVIPVRKPEKNWTLTSNNDSEKLFFIHMLQMHVLARGRWERCSAGVLALANST